MGVNTSSQHIPSRLEFNKLFVNILGPESQYYKVVLVYSVAISLLTLAIPISVQMLIDSVANTGLSSAVITIGLILFVLLLFSGILYALRAWTMELFSRHLFSRVAGEIAMSGLLARKGFFEQGSRSALINRFYDIMTLKKNVPYILSNGFTFLFQMLIGFIVVSLYHFYFFIFCLGLAALLWLIWKLWGWKAIASAFVLSEAKHDTAAWLQSLTVNNSFFKTRQGSQYALDKTDIMIREHVTAQREHFIFSFRQLLSLLLLYALASAVLLIIGGQLVIMGELTLGQLVAAELIMSAIFYSLPQLSGYLDYYYDVCAAAEELHRLQHIDTETLAEPESLPWPVDGSLKIQQLRILLAQQPLLFELELKPGTAVKAIAESSQLQTVFCRLLRRDLSPDSGSLLLGDIDLTDCNIHDLRSRVRIISRQTLLPLSIRAYLTMQDNQVSTAKLQQILSQVELLEELELLPKGLDTELSYSGAPLVLDQVLRLKLAHALLGDTRVLVLTQIYDCLPADFLNRFIQSWKANQGILIYFTARQDLDAWDTTLDLQARQQLLQAATQGDRA